MSGLTLTPNDYLFLKLEEVSWQEGILIVLLISSNFLAKHVDIMKTI